MPRDARPWEIASIALRFRGSDNDVRLAKRLERDKVIGIPSKADLQRIIKALDDLGTECLDLQESLEISKKHAYR